MYHFRRDIKKLISNLELTDQHCQSMRMNSEAKPSEAKAAKSELSVSIIPVDESKKEEKTLVLSSVLAELLVHRKEDKEMSGDSEGVEQKGGKKRCQ